MSKDVKDFVGYPVGTGESKKFSEISYDLLLLYYLAVSFNF